MYLRRFGFDADPLFGPTFFSPSAGVRGLQHEMNRLFEGVFNEGGSSYPPLDVMVGDSSVVLRAEVPGMSPEHLDLSVTGSTVTLKGERSSDENDSQGEKYLRRERGVGAFSRTVELPFSVEVDGVQAEYKHGILTVTLPRAEADKPKRIKIR
jgi:HSP20 family protein